ncbi:hepatocyte growth factor-regulated tyrosine kinase substrate [Camelus ferus]|nr:hepatocyte growth factor-regulated tyrosine kinase substrate [Camelus ferus]
MRIRQEMKNPISNKKRKKEAQVAFRKTLEKEAKGEEPDIAVPKFTQRKWESDGAYVRRMEQEAQHVLFLSKNQASRQPEARAAPRKEKSERKKAFQKRRLEKARQRREEKAAERLEQELLQDMVKFGEVVLQPPELTAKPRMSMSRGQLCLHLPGSASQPGGRVLMLEKSLSPGTASQPQSTSPARQRIVVQERERAVQAYRALKRLQRQQQGPQPSGSPRPASRKTPEARLRWAGPGQAGSVHPRGWGSTCPASTCSQALPSQPLRRQLEPHQLLFRVETDASHTEGQQEAVFADTWEAPTAPPNQSGNSVLGDVSADLTGPVAPTWNSGSRVGCVGKCPRAKYAVSSIKKKVNDKNPHVALYALEVMESVVKNCGQTVHDEVANKQTMEELKELLKRQVEVNVRNKILYLIQAWAHAFRNEPKYKVVQDTYQIMKVEGHVFPEFKESDAMFAAERAPDWVDAEECHRCRVQFGVVTRKHHCRACGQIFCGKCSSKYSTIPKFGIEKEVRVCEPCYEQLNNPLGTGLALASLWGPLSALRHPGFLSDGQGCCFSGPRPLTPPTSPQNSSAPLAEDIDPELARYLNRNYWEKKQEEARRSPTPSAPVPLTEPTVQPTEGLSGPASVETPLPEMDPQPVTPAGGSFSEYQNGESEESHAQFLKALQNAVTTFVNRMKSNHVRGRSITNDSAVLSLFQSINGMHPQLLELLNQLDERRLYYEGLQDKLAQIRDARGALSALREEHREKLRRAAEEAERQRQIQLAQKLEIMRQKKQEYLEVQRQLAIQRLQEQEKERQMRLEQQKQTIQMRAQMPAFSLPYAQARAQPCPAPSGDAGDRELL